MNYDSAPTTASWTRLLSVKMSPHSTPTNPGVSPVLAASRPMMSASRETSATLLESFLSCPIFSDNAILFANNPYSSSSIRSILCL